MSTAVSTHTGAGPLSLMSCVRESSPPQDLETEYENEKNVGGQKKKRFWNRWFSKRKNKVSEDQQQPSPPSETTIDLPRESQRSRSTSELSETEEPVTKRRTGTPMHPGLSVSHDSVFHSPHSGSEIELEGAQSSSSLSIHHQHQTDRLLQTELTERLRLRRGRGDTSEDDEGLPRSPCNSPTATDKTAIKDNPKSHSTCSEGSLLSVGSSEMDEDSFGQHSIHSSKLSLDDKNNTIDSDFDLDLGLKNSSAPLNHSGARHKASVKPQRRYGAPRKKRLSGSVLPTTPEVNEENAIRSITPEVNSSSVKETVTELYHTASATTTAISTSSKSSIIKSSRTLTEKQLKCSSLPPGLAPPGSDSGKLNRSRSNAGTKYQEEFSALGEEEEAAKDAKKSDSFLGRIFPRRSVKKRKSKEEKVINTSSTTLSSTKQSEIVESSHHLVTREFIQTKSESVSTGKPIPVPRTGAAARQRVVPNDIPASPDMSRKTEDMISKSPTERMHAHSPLQIELEKNLQQRLASLSTSPKVSPVIRTPPISPKTPRSPLVSPPKSPLSYPKIPPKSHLIEKTGSKHTKIEDVRSKIVISGLSAFQQRAINNNNNEDDGTDGFKSLDLPNEVAKPTKLVAKSHSFKINTNTTAPGDNSITNNRVTTTFAELASTRSTQEIQTITKTTTSTEFKIEKIEGADDIKKLEVVDQSNEDDVKIIKEEIESRTENIELIPSVEVSESLQIKEDIEESPSPGVEIKEFHPKTSQEEHKESFLNNIFDSATNFINSGITISGPRHKAIVSVTNRNMSETATSELKTDTGEVKIENNYKEVKEQQISVTKIQVKQESMQTTKTTLPEFMNIQLHKVDKPANNVVLTAGFQDNKVEDQIKPLAGDSPDLVTPQNQNFRTSVEAEKVAEAELVQSTEGLRKFSKEDIEVVDKSESEDDKKHVVTALVTITTMTPPVPTRAFKKSDFQLRKSMVSVNNTDKPILKTKSSSLDIVESIKSSEDVKIEDRIEMKAKTQSANDLNESSEPVVPLRRKSVAKHKQEDEPELMKVFARRSLKLKDGESESLSQQVIKMMEETNNSLEVKSRDSDKENHLDSPSEERKRIIQKDLPKFKDPLLENKFAEPPTDVALRKPITTNNNNKLHTSYQRAVSLNNAKTNEFNSYERMQKQNSLVDRPKTEQWFNYKSTDSDSCPKICQEEIMSTISEKTLIEREEFSTKPKNFNQRKAEWEKRAQEASRKTAP